MSTKIEIKKRLKDAMCVMVSKAILEDVDDLVFDELLKIRDEFIQDYYVAVREELK